MLLDTSRLSTSEDPQLVGVAGRRAGAAPPVDDGAVFRIPTQTDGEPCL